MAKKEKETKKVEKATKISNEHLNKMQGTINELNRTQMQIGSMYTNLHQMSHNVLVLNDELTLMQADFDKEYGTHDVNIADGTINHPKEDVKTD